MVPITELRIEGLRTIERVKLALDGLTVLIGENGSGKSSILEACEILRRATGKHFIHELYGIHGGLSALMHPSAPALRLGVTIRPRRKELSEPGLFQEVWVNSVDCLRYDLTIAPSGSFASIEETIAVKSSPKPHPGRKKVT
jgi:predicted ATPase